MAETIASVKYMNVLKILPNLHAVYEGRKRARFEITVRTSAPPMGQSISSRYSNSPLINQLLETGQWEMVLDCVGGEQIVDVKLNEVARSNRFQHKYVVKYNNMIPPNCIMAVIFPLHPERGKRILWTTGDLPSLSTEINARIKESGREKSQIVVTCGDRFYRFHGNIGTLYLVWAERLNHSTVNIPETLIAENVPMLIELDRKWGYKNFFIFDNTEVTALGDIQAYDPFQCPIFCCETDPREEALKRVMTVTNSSADQATSELVIIDALGAVEEPFQ
jgi:hypothetical protein